MLRRARPRAGGCAAPGRTCPPAGRSLPADRHRDQVQAAVQVSRGQLEVARADPGHRPAQLLVPGPRRAGQLRVHQRAELPVQPAQPRSVPQPEQPADREARPVQQLGELTGSQLPVVERVHRAVRRREGQPVRGGQQQGAGRSQHPAALAEELRLVPQVLQHLQAGHHVDAGGGQRQPGQLGTHGPHPRVRRPHLRDRRPVVVQPEHRAGHRGDPVGAVPLPAAGLQHHRTGAERGQGVVRGLVPAEPVVLLRDARQRPLAGELERRVHHGGSLAYRTSRRSGAAGRRAGRRAADSRGEETGRRNREPAPVSGITAGPGLPPGNIGAPHGWRRTEGVNIVVLVKQVPDTWAERRLSESDRTLDRESVDAVMNEIDEYAVEEALRLKEAHGGEVTVLTMGPERATETIRKALSMGADKAVHVNDPALHGSCAVQTAETLAAALGTVPYDLVVLGSESTDARLSVMAAMLSEKLGLPQLSGARKVEVDGTTVTIERQTDTGFDRVQGSTPAVLSVVEKINEPRYPSFKGIMAAKKKPVTAMTVADLGLDPGSVGLAAATSEVVEQTPRPPRQAGQIVKDEGDGGAKIADFLAAQKLL